MTVRSRKLTKRNRRRWRRILISLGVIFTSCCLCVGVAAVVGASGVLNTPTPALDANASNATIVALISYTQTAGVQVPITGPTNTEASLATESPPPTATNAPSQTFSPAITNAPAETFTALPTRTPIPTSTPVPELPTLNPLQGITAICNDGSYSYSQHRQGTCSHHGGVKEWINKPPS
jgi:uncharacterized protein DUF3761